MIKEVISKFIDEHNLTNKTVIVGFSGGYDSMCLLDVMQKLAPEKNIKLIAAHYNHNWRGEIARTEQLRCEEFCEEKNIEFFTQTASIDVKKTETEARKLRYKFFEDAIKQYCADVVFTAHNYNDNAETVLYRIIKGTGVVGLRGILSKRDIFYRPLLSVTRKEIEKYCVDNGLSPNNDNSNSDTKYKRNFIRHEILPVLKKINPEILKSLNTLAEVSSSETNIIEEYLSKLSKDMIVGNKIDLAKFKNLSKDVKQRLLYKFIYDSGFDYDYSMIKNIFNFVEENISQKKISKYSLSNDTWLYLGDKYIEIIKNYEKQNDVVTLDKEGTYTFGESLFSISKCLTKEKNCDETIAFVDLSKYNNLTLRTRKDGDIISPLGLKGTMKLKKYLIDKKIPQHKRDKLLLLCKDDEVLWVAGVGLSDKIKTITNPTHKLSVKYNEDIL